MAPDRQPAGPTGSGVLRSATRQREEGRVVDRAKLETEPHAQLKPSLPAAGDDSPEIHVRQTARWLTELRGVQHVLSLDSELERGRSRLLKAAQEKIQPLDLWPAHVRIGSCSRAERKRRRLRERGGVEPAIERLLTSGHRRIADEVRVSPESGGDAIARRHGANHERPAARERADPAQPPAANRMREPAIVGPPLAGTDR